MITDYHAKYYAHELSISHSNNGVDRLSQSLFDASVDLNPHQIEAALFALDNPLNKGVVLADEVGLGKTIEASLVLCQYWAERKRRLIIICPAALRRQWAQELQEKFNLPSVVLDAKTWSDLQKQGAYNPLNNKQIVIMSYHYAARIEDRLVAEPWNLVVIDEAHKLRNAHRDSNKMGQALKRAFFGRQKLLLTATPLQNSLMEVYGLSTVIDEHLFGDDKAFRKQFMTGGGDMPELKERLGTFVKRTLRKNVLEYIRYTERKTLTVPFSPSDVEQDLYDSVSVFLEKEESYALPPRQRHLTGLVLRKLLASSSQAVLNTLKTIKKRLEKLRDENLDEDITNELLEDEVVTPEYLDEQDESEDATVEKPASTIDMVLLQQEIADIELFINKAESIESDSKLKALIQALESGFEQMRSMGAQDKAIIFTESKRTQEYIARFLSANGFAGKTVLFSGTNNTPETTEIYKQWLSENAGSDRVSGSPQIDRRTALIDWFKNHAQIMVATEAAAEGVNLQFCSLLINYDLPWNPQRVEQRIGRCHRYGQQFDVVVINFLNRKNYADQRVLELLTHKFRLFDGVFGASDEVLGSIESGVDFEKRIQEIYKTCRSPDEIAKAFDDLQQQLEDQINSKLKETQQLLLENFDEDVHELLKIKMDEAEQRLDKLSRWFWLLTKHQLSGIASFDDSNLSFILNSSPHKCLSAGAYELIRANGTKREIGKHSHAYRLNHALGEWVVQQAIEKTLPVAEIIFDYSAHNVKVSVIEGLVGTSGSLRLQKFSIESLERVEEHLIFAAVDSLGNSIPSEVAQKLMNMPAFQNNVPGFEVNETIQFEAKLVDVLASERNKVEKSVNDKNLSFFEQEVNKLDAWADDLKDGLEQSIKEIDKEIKQVRREAKIAPTLEEKLTLQKQQKKLESQRNKNRRELFDKQDEVDVRREALIESLEGKLNKKTAIENLFTIRWSVK